MGFSVSWVAIRDIEPSEVLAFFSLSYSGETCEHPDSYYRILAIELPNNWFLIQFNEFLPPELEAQTFAELSKLGWVVGCHIHEGVMVSFATSYHAGIGLWDVTHKSDLGLNHLATKGFPPKYFNGVFADMERCYQENSNGCVDYHFDIPIALAQHIVGYRHDRNLQLNNNKPFHVLQPISASKPPTSTVTRKKRFVSSFSRPK